MLLLKKRTVFVALLCFSIFSVINAQTYYYYYNNKKIKLFPDSLSFGIMTVKPLISNSHEKHIFK